MCFSTARCRATAGAASKHFSRNLAETGCSCRAAAVPHPHCHHATLQSVQCHRRSLSCHQQMWIHIVRQLLDSKVSKDGILTEDVAGSQTIHYLIYIVAMRYGSKPCFCSQLRQLLDLPPSTLVSLTSLIKIGVSKRGKSLLQGEQSPKSLLDYWPYLR